MFSYLLILIIILPFVSADEHWGYANVVGELDPDHWYVKYKNCIGDRQSPIDIEKEDVEYDYSLKPITFEGYDLPVYEAQVINDGHTGSLVFIVAVLSFTIILRQYWEMLYSPIRVDLPDDSQAFIMSSSFNTSYKLKQLHFHWSHHDNAGSEHMIFQKHYPLEMHFVHADETVSYDEALMEPYGLVVVSVLFIFGNSTEGMLQLTNHFKYIKDPKLNNETTITDLNLLDLLPTNLDNYLQYAGSLTTPPCNEAVKWIILTHTNFITHQQMADFRNLKRLVIENGKSAEEELETNDRTLQGVKGRKVYLHYNFDDLIR